MSQTEFWVFVLMFIAPIMYQRCHFLWRPADFQFTPIRSLTGLQIHHAHWGLLWIAAATGMFIAGERNRISIGLAGLGWGLLADEIIPHLRMPSNDRNLELKVYATSEPATIRLAQIILIIVWLLSYARQAN